MGKPINENPNPAPNRPAPVVRLHPSAPKPDGLGTYVGWSLHDKIVNELKSERDAALARAEKAEAEAEQLAKDRYAEQARAEKAEAEATEWMAASAINGSNMAGYQTRSIVAEERLVKAEARAERLAAEVIAWRRAAAIFDGSGNPLGIHFFQHTHGARVAVDAHRDLEGKEHVGGVCWMIERGQRHGEVEPLYWTGADWSKDPCKGMRFANSRAATDYAVAEVLLSGIEGVHPRKWEVTEHVFMDAHRDLEGGAA